MIDFFHYFQWQGKHMHTLHFVQNEQGNMYCPTCQSVYQKRKPKTLSTNTAAAKAPVSVFTALSIGLLLLGFVLLMAGTVFSLPYVVALGGFDAIASVTLAVLSLREKQ